MTRTTLRRAFGLILGASLLLGSAVPALAARPEACAGIAAIDAVTSAPEVRAADGTLFVSFTFVGTHTVCFADGSTALGQIEGTLWQRIAPNGDLTLRFAETLTYGDGSLDFRGQATLAGGVWTSAVRTVGTGTGSLAGIHGQGEFWPLGATSFGDAIWYVYP